MNWGHFYLICFGTGFIFSLFSFLLGSFHWHMPHGDGHVHVAPHSHGISTDANRVHPAPAAAGHHFSFLNPAIFASFLTWFGAAGYLITRYTSFGFFISFLFSLLSGCAGAAIIFLFLSRVLMSREGNWDLAVFPMTGVLGRTSVTIREGGTGEIIYSQAGTRRTCGARSENGIEISKGSEVVVTRYEKGIAYVRLWSDIAGDDEVGAETKKQENSLEKESR